MPAPQPGSVFLPLPRVPHSPVAGLPEPDLLDDLKPGAGEIVRQIRDLYDQAQAAVGDLAAHRPGGLAWGAAQTADNQAAVEGRTPKQWQLAALLAADPDRWARASALARTLVARCGTVRDAADLDALHLAAQQRLGEHQDEIHTALTDSWRAHRAGDRLPALDAWATAEALADRARTLDAAMEWIRPTGGRPRTLLLRDKASLGLWHACRVAVAGHNPPSLWPEAHWPTGFNPADHTHRPGEADRLERNQLLTTRR